MIGRTLTDIRAELESLADDEGEFYVRCGRTGERPVPVDRHRFPDRSSAVEAVRIAHAYRATLRRYDPRAPWYDFVVCEAESGVASGRERSFPPATGADADSRQALRSYCHDVAGAVFEALSVSDHDGVERAVMDAYLAVAESTPDRDRLCLRLIAVMATELQTRLPGPARAGVLRRATVYLPAVPPSPTPVRDALDHLRTKGLLTDFDRGEGATDRSRPVVVRGYEFVPIDGRLPLLPLSVEIARRTAGRPPAVTDAARIDGDWRVAFSPGARADCTAARIDG